MHAAILALLLSYAPWYQDRQEPAEDRRARLGVVAEAIDDATTRATCQGLDPCTPIWPGRPVELAAALARTGWFESRYARHIHEGRCGRWECDPFKLPSGRIVHRALSVWQVQPSRLVPTAEWRTIRGADYGATSRAAWAAARVLSASYRRCQAPGRPAMLGAVSGYATGYSCRWSKAHGRVALIERDVRRLSAAE
jgi:hypothetical protein